MHKSELADCVGRKEAEPPTTMIETNKSTKSRRIIVCPPFAGIASNLGLMALTRLKIVDGSLCNVTQKLFSRRQQLTPEKRI